MFAGNYARKRQSILGGPSVLLSLEVTTTQRFPWLHHAVNSYPHAEAPIIAVRRAARVCVGPPPAAGTPTSSSSLKLLTGTPCDLGDQRGRRM